MAELRIQEGKYYRTRDGLRVGPMRRMKPPYDACWTDGISDWNTIGASLEGTATSPIVAEWSDPEPQPAAPVYRVGDRVRIEAEISGVDGEALSVRYENGGYGVNTVIIHGAPCLVEHIPAPRPIEGGDRVMHADADWTTFGEVIAIDGDRAWVRRKTGLRPVFCLSELTRLHDSEVAK